MDNIHGQIINIQRFSIHDGPGIRTTVFMKGCNLRCLWCHNPESQSPGPQRMLYRHKCVNCGACREICERAFFDQCDSCGKCVAVCRHGAREIVGRTVFTEELFAELIKDKAFYETSGGGVTFSGGEPLLQPEFLLTLLRLCKSENIHTAIETAGNVKWEVLASVLPYTDLILYDLKAMDPEVHQAYTGVTNVRILENARSLMETCPEKLLFRMPVVPGCNDTEVDQAAFFVGDCPLELLPYHRTGIGKYEALGLPYRLEDVQPPTLETMRKLTAGHDNLFCEENIV